jgi:hypothetical protein
VCRNRVVASSYLELEAELLPEGKEDDLRSIVAELVEEWNLVPERQSKFERALALFPQGMVLDTSAERGAPARLSKEERVAVEHLALERDVIARRARVLLAWDDGLSREEMAQRSGLSHGRVRYWVSQFSQKRMSVFPPEAVARVKRGAGLGSRSPRTKRLRWQGRLPVRRLPGNIDELSCLTSPELSQTIR